MQRGDKNEVFSEAKLPSGSLANGVSSKRLKTFLTTFSTSEGVFSWEIKAYDFDEAERICKRINHKLNGKEIKV